MLFYIKLRGLSEIIQGIDTIILASVQNNENRYKNPAINLTFVKPIMVTSVQTLSERN